MPRVVHFEINVDKPERAIKFYNKVFDWKIEKWGSDEQNYWMVTTGPDKEPGINGALMKRMDSKATTVNSIDVPSVDDFVARVTKAGGKVFAPKMSIPGVGYMAYCQDTEGNTFGLWQADKTAK